MKKTEEILNYFNILKKRALLGSSYLFIGEDFSLVDDIIKLINCENGSCGKCWDCKQIERGTHPDLFILSPEGFSIKIEQIREGIKFLCLKSFKLQYKVLIIKEAQNLGQAAANAFLKTLEEPPQNSFIAVCTSKLEGMLPTIISRCRKIFLPSGLGEVDPSMKLSVISFLEGQQVEFSDRKKFSNFLWALIVLLRKHLTVCAGWQNKELPKNEGYEIILQSKRFDKIHSVLKNVLKIYGARDNINMNLALNLIRMQL